MNRFHVITGAPGTGKSAILRALGDEVSTVPEPARRVLADWRAAGNPRPAQIDPELFVDLLSQTSVADHAAALDIDGPVVFDRGVVDAAAYARHLECDDSSALDAASGVTYHRRVFLTPPWEGIYTTDEERTMSFDLVVRFHEILVPTYEEAGYDLVEVPRGSVAERAAFVRDSL